MSPSTGTRCVFQQGGIPKPSTISCRGPATLWRRQHTTRRHASAAISGESEAAYDPTPGSALPKSSSEARLRAIKTAKPFSAFLTDTFNRQHDYLRISITEKCNLRCLYCMPEEGVPLSPKKHLLTPAEISYLSLLFVSQGVTKIRLTGGEPTIHPQILPILREIGSLRSKGLKELALTTNGLTLLRKLDSMAEYGVTGINLSLDTLDPFQFEIMTRRKGFEQVMKSIDRILDMNKLGANITLKVNVVVIRGLNDSQIMPFIEMTRENDIEIRFIEYMPFDGNRWSSQKMMGYQEMLAIIREKYPETQKVQDHPNDTSKSFKVPGFKGRIGFITSMTENFCGTCNRLRITSDGNLKVCLFGNAEVSLRDMLRINYNNGEPLDQEAWEAMKQVEMDRREGRQDGELGLQAKEMGLLEIIGAAVKKKKAAHAGMGNLEHMKNRPMILIDDRTGQAHGTAARLSNPLDPVYRPWEPIEHQPYKRNTYLQQHMASNRHSSILFPVSSGRQPTSARFFSTVAPRCDMVNTSNALLTTSETQVIGNQSDPSAEKFAAAEGASIPPDTSSSPTPSHLTSKTPPKLRTTLQRHEGVGRIQSRVVIRGISVTKIRQTPGFGAGRSASVERARALSNGGGSKRFVGRTKGEESPQSEEEGMAGQTLTHLNDRGEALMVLLPPPFPPGDGACSSTSATNSAVKHQSHKPPTTRTATAVSTVVFGNALPWTLLSGNVSTHAAHTPQSDVAALSKANIKTGGGSDVLPTARIAGIMAAKRTSDLIPLCHNIALAGVSVDLSIIPPDSGARSSHEGAFGRRGPYEHGAIEVKSCCTSHSQTGVEMEALVAASVAGLTVYDMLKAVDRGMKVEGVRVVEKTGGKSGDWRVDQSGILRGIGAGTEATGEDVVEAHSVGEEGDCRHSSTETREEQGYERFNDFQPPGDLRRDGKRRPESLTSNEEMEKAKNFSSVGDLARGLSL